MRRSGRTPSWARSATCGREPSSRRARGRARSSRSRTRASAEARRCRTPRTSATPRSARGRTSAPATSRPTSPTILAGRRAAPSSAATSGPASTMPSLLLSRLATMLGLRRAPSSQRMSPPDPSRGSRHARSPKRTGSMTSATTTPTEARLPGLDVEVAAPQMKPNHWLERGNPKRLMVFSGRSHPELARRISEHLGVELGEIELHTFGNGETYCRYDESIRGADLFIVQTGCQPVDQNLMELLFMIQAAKLASAKRITAVIPWFPYARQDRKAKPREPISARLLADMLQLAGADRVLTMDLHAGQIQGFFTIPVDHMTSLPLFARHFRDLGLTGSEVVSVAPDAGRAKHALRFAEMIEADFAIMHKTRPAHDQVEVTEITGRVQDKTVILGDDVIMTGGTLLANVEALKDQGAKDVWVFATHGLFSGNALEHFGTAEIAQVVVTDTVPINPLEMPPNMTVLPVAQLLAETIMNVFADDSVSAIFGGENQLF